MLLWIAVVALTVGNALSYDFADVYKTVPEEARVLVRGQAGVSCEGAVWRRRYVLARDSCLRDKSPLHLAVVKNGRNNTKTYSVSAIFTHPGHKEPVKDYQYDVTLLILNEPFFDDTESLLFDFPSYSYEPWMYAVAYYFENERQFQEQYVYLHKSNVFSSKLQMFLFTIVLPFGMFVIFFIIVIVYVGSKSDGFEYNELNDKKNEDILKVYCN